MGKPTTRDELPLHPITAYEPFDKWGMDFIGPIDPPSNQNNCILMCTDYLTKWVEVKALRESNETVVVEFLNENSFTEFGVLREIVKNQGTQFNSKMVWELMKKIKYNTNNLLHTTPKPMDRWRLQTKNCRES